MAQDPSFRRVGRDFPRGVPWTEQASTSTTGEESNPSNAPPAAISDGRLTMSFDSWDMARYLIAVMVLMTTSVILLTITSISPSSSICQFYKMEKVFPVCKPPLLVTMPNVPIFLNAHLETMKAYDLALRGNCSQELLKSRTALGDLSTQVKYSDLSTENKGVFSSTLKLLRGATTEAAYEMEILEAKATSTFHIFIERSRMIQRALMQIDTHIELLPDLHTIFNQAMVDASRGMESLDFQVGIVRKRFAAIGDYFDEAYDVFIREKNVQCKRKNLFATAWVVWSSDHVERGLLENNLEILGLFGNEYSTRKEELERMGSALRKFREQVEFLSEQVRIPLLEKGHISTHVKAVNEAIDALEAEYRKYRMIG